MLAAVALPALAEAQAIQAWVQRYDGPANSDDIAWGLAVDTNGDLYVVGTSTAVTYPPPLYDPIPDFVTIKYSSAGTALWTNLYDGSVNGGDSAKTVAVDATGNVFVTGDCSEGTGHEFLTIKYSSAGLGLWTNRYSPASYGQALAVDASGNVVVAGRGKDGFGCTMIKYSGIGAQLWARNYSLSLAAMPESRAMMAMDTNGDVVVTGHWDLGTGTGEDYVTLKYSSAGVPLWTNRYNGPGNSYDRYTCVALDASGNVFVTGKSASTNAYPYNFDYTTIKYSGAGVPLWTNRYDGPANDEDGPSALAVDAGGNAIVTGYSWNGTDYEYVTIKYSSAAVPLWTNRYNGPGKSQDIPNAMALDLSGNVYVTGGSGGDYVTIAYSSAGLPLWTNRYNGPANCEDTPYALVLDAHGNVYVTGRSANTNVWPYGYDHATVKYVVPPIITRQPHSRTNAVSTIASFTVEAGGNAPLTYQWCRQGTNLVEGGNISGVTTTDLLIANVQTSDAAGYSVVITNAYGSVTSVVAQLTVIVPPNPGRFSNLSYSPETGLSFIFRDGTVGQHYRIQTSSSLAAGSWVDWQSFTYTGPIGFMDVGATGAERRFYRAVSP